MKGDAGDNAEPLTLGMLERLESIVKVRDQMKFNVKNGRKHLVQSVFVLIFFSLMQVVWEFVKILTYQANPRPNPSQPAPQAGRTLARRALRRPSARAAQVGHLAVAQRLHRHCALEAPAL